MNDCIKELSETIDKFYKRNRSLVDTMSKAQLSLEKTIRAVTKAATHCGCIEFCAKKQPSGLEENVPALIEGKLCPDCYDEIEKEMGQSVFYIISLMILLGFDPCEIITKEKGKINLLGKFNLR